MFAQTGQVGGDTERERRIVVTGEPRMPNHQIQAMPGFAWLLWVSPRAGTPDLNRSAAFAHL